MDLTQLSLTDLKHNEHLIAVVRHHWFMLLRSVIGIAVIFLVPFIVVPLAGFYFTQAGIATATIGAIFGLLGSLWALICWQLLFVYWTDYYFDIWIITNWRIVDIDQQGLFRRNIASILNLDHIQDIETELNGVLGNLLNFGDIAVQTAGTKREFSFDNVANPSAVERIIRSAQEELLKIRAHPEV